MDAIKGNIYAILNGSKQFIIPPYQRIYSWEISQCTQLWSDIVDMQKKNKAGHFVGAIVNIAEQAMPTGVQRYMIIDGQQRITTLTLLMIALRDYAQKHPDDRSVNEKRIDNMLLKNEYESGDDRYKLILTETDRKILIDMIENKPLQGNYENSRLITNYKFFENKINSYELLPSEIYESVGKLQIVNITLDRAQDDAQAIFESLNSTGKELSQTDLIRNNLLMGLEPCNQSYIYEHYWRPLEKLFDYKDEFLMDRFFRDYLTLKNSKITKQDYVYQTFKLFKNNSKFSEDIEGLCQDLFKFAQYYTDIVYRRSPDKDIKSLYDDIVELRMEVAYPLFLWARQLVEENKISLDDYKYTLKLSLSYVLRRNVCAIPTNSLNKTFSALINTIDCSNFLNSLKFQFASLSSYKVFPNNEEFEKALTTRDLYNTRNLSFILSHLENYDNKSPINSRYLTIEHIMPQNPKLSKDWQISLGENWRETQKKYLHTLGNLTLTAYNSEMSDKSFKEKLEIEGGFKQSALRLNSYVIKQPIWSASNIEERAKILSKIALKIWTYPDLTDEQLAELQSVDDVEQPSKYHIDDYEYYLVNKPIFEELNQRILNISSDISVEYNKRYISYKVYNNFANIIFLSKGLKINLNIPYTNIKDPLGLCRDISNIGHWGNGDVEFIVASLNDIDNALALIMQAYVYETEEI